MPKVIGHTPSWLSHPSPGARIFSDPEAQSPASPSKKFAALKSPDDRPKSTDAGSAKRTIAHRGTEVFAVVGNKIRWADLARVKENWKEQGHRRPSQQVEQHDNQKERAYRTLKTPVYYQITNLSVSPSGHFLAISTEHTVHVAFLPDSSRLRDGDLSEIKLKTYQLGPTTHVIPEAPLASVLWHPLAASSPLSDCLVTVTSEAAVRVWEVERSNHWSFERPALAIDLRKLADGTSSDQDFEPSGFGKNRGFSVDAFDMEAAAACFGGRGAENEDPWAATTLWTTMTNGDVYALCPLLPTKWRPTTTTIPALTTSAVSRMAGAPTEDIDADERRAADQRYEWVQELDNEVLGLGDSSDQSIRIRPSNPSAIPRLQGPFELPVDEINAEGDIADILVIPSNLDEEDLFSGEEDYDILSGSKSLPFTVVCLTTTSNRLHVMIELEGVTGQWLPKKGRSHFSVSTWDAGEFVLLDTLSLSSTADPANNSPAFTRDLNNSYHFFVTVGRSILSLSLEEWATRVALDVARGDSDDIDAGLQTRLEIACKDSICIRKDLITDQAADSAIRMQHSVATFIDDVDFGCLVLTSPNERAIAAQLDQNLHRVSNLMIQEPSFATSLASPSRASQSLMQVLQPDNEPNHDAPPVRAPYAPSQIFYQNQMAPLNHLKSRVPQHRGSIFTDKPLRLSPACLEVMSHAHKTFSLQTSVIEKAAAELFRRCERLQEELTDQVRQMAELAERLNRLGTSDNDDEDEPKHDGTAVNHDAKVSKRLEQARTRQKELFSRYERVRRKAGQVGHAKQDLSVKEQAWIEEVDSLARHVGVESDAKSQVVRGQETSLHDRLSAARSLSHELVDEAQRIKDETKDEANDQMGEQRTSDGKLRSRLTGSGGMSKFQKEKIKEVMEMVEREAAIIEAVQGRLGRLSIK